MESAHYAVTGAFAKRFAQRAGAHAASLSYDGQKVHRSGRVL